jgi:DNA-binding LytR/AlgR family response regulator
MRILIVEDEPLAAARLAANISAIKPDAEIVAVCDTVKASVSWLNANVAPDLAFFDIQLGDGLSFEIFDQVEFNQPVIFTTAFENYAIQAFKVNSVDYLLKPVERDELSKALLKYDTQKSSNLTPHVLKELMSSLTQKSYKERFLVKTGAHLKVVKTRDVLYFYSFEKGTYAKCSDGKDYLMDQSLEFIEDSVDPRAFFRINRKFLVSLTCITDVIAYSNSRLKLKITGSINDDFLVAREKVKAFKNWLEGI